MIDYLAHIERAHKEIQQAKDELNLLIVLAWEDGVPQSDIAQVLGVSRQRVGYIVRDNGTKKYHPEKVSHGIKRTDRNKT